jgi:hypothetical protein
MKYRTFKEKYGIEKIEAHWWKILDENEQKKRLEICNQCNQFDGEKCDACGCHIKSKIISYYSECPYDKWEVFPHVE